MIRFRFVSDNQGRAVGQADQAHAEVVAAAFRSIFALGTSEEVSARWDEVEANLAERFPKAAALTIGARTDALAFRAFPRAHWRKIWSNDPLERLNKEVKRRSNVEGVFPNDAAATSSKARWPSSTTRATLIPISPQSAADHIEITPSIPTTPRGSVRARRARSAALGARMTR